MTLSQHLYMQSSICACAAVNMLPILSLHDIRYDTIVLYIYTTIICQLDRFKVLTEVSILHTRIRVSPQSTLLSLPIHF